MRFRHRLKFTRPGGGGVQDPDTGVIGGGAGETVLYDGPGDMQDAGEAIARRASGMPELNSEGTAYLAIRAAAKTLEPDDALLVGWDSPTGAWETQSTSDARVTFARILDGAVLVRYL